MPNAVSYKVYRGDEVTVVDISVVGSYAVSIEWKDGHNTGMYEFQYLKEDIEKDTTKHCDNLQKAVAKFKSMGVTLKEVKLPENFPFKSFDVILRSEAGAFFDELDGKVMEPVKIVRGKQRGLVFKSQPVNR